MKIPLEHVWWFLSQQQKTARLQSRVAAGFSLIELLIVVALILILSVLLYGSGSRSYQKKQQRACQSNLLKVYVALEIFATDHADAFPAQAGSRTSEEPLALLVPRYTADTTVFICPGSGDSQLPSGQPLTRGKVSYAYVMGRHKSDSNEMLMSDKQVDTEPKYLGQSLFSSTGKPPGDNHHKYGGNCLFVDGRVEISPATAAFPVTCPEGVVVLNPKP